MLEHGHSPRVVDNASCCSQSQEQAVHHGAKVCCMVHRLLDFREAEIVAAADTEGIRPEALQLRLLSGDHHFSPLRIIEVPTDELCRRICRRSILLKGIYEVWGVGGTLQEVKASIARCPDDVKARWLRANVSFKWHIEGFGRKLSKDEQIKLMATLADVCPFQGKVQLNNPDVTLAVIWIDVGSDTGLPQEIPRRVVVARELESAENSARAGIQPFTLTRRRYLGPTSMDNELSFVMCNMARVRRGALVLDPFAGTGSILVAAAALGAATIGGDIDIRVIRDGKRDAHGRRCNVYSNFADYRLQEPAGLLRMDMSHAPWQAGRRAWLDAIVCDPPYGVRAGGRKMVPRAPGQPERDNYIPATQAYSLSECLRDLLEAAAQLLVPGGRLAYWMPDIHDDSDPTAGDASGRKHRFPSKTTPVQALEASIVGSVHRDPLLTARGFRVPEHPTLRVVGNSVQVLSSRYVRRLITMEKVHNYDAGAVAAWQAAHGEPALAVDSIHDVVYEPRDVSRPVATKKKTFRGKGQ